MKIEEEIKQTKFKSEFHKLQLNLIFTANELRSRISEVLKPWGLTPEQYNVLRILRGQHPNPSSINLLTERMLDKMSNASRLVDKLTAKELAIREWSIDDRRKAEVLITEKGLQLLKEIDETADLRENGEDTISEEEARVINELLDKFRG